MNFVKIQLERCWPDRTAGNFLFPQSANAGSVANSAFNPTESFGQLFATAAAATPSGGLSNYTPGASASSAGVEYPTHPHHHLPTSLSETGWKSSGGGSVGNSAGTEMPCWTGAPTSFNGFENYNGLATGEMFMGHHHHHHHQTYADVGKAASASFSYGHHHNPAVVGVSSAAAAAVAYRNYNLAKGTSAAAASFGFY